MEELRKLGAMWAGDLPHTDYKVSPGRGDVSQFPPSLIIVGIHEIFNVDVMEFYQKLQDAGRKTQILIGKKMNHVYPIYPIPEAKTAMKTILDWIKS